MNIGDIIGTNLIIEKDIEKTKIKHHGTYWKVKCTLCGNIRSVRSDNLTQKCRSCAAKNKPLYSSVKDNLINKTFGYWKVLDKAKRSNYWICECQNCGTIKEVFRGGLTSGQSKSCGCINSWGEVQISYWLNKYNINYQKEVCFLDLKTDKNRCPRFDFVLYQNKQIFCIIEYDGRQHYSFNENWKMSEEDFKRLQYIDELKNEYCKNKNIPLYRFNKNTDLEQEIKKIYCNICVNKEVGEYLERSEINGL